MGFFPDVPSLQFSGDADRKPETDHLFILHRLPHYRRHLPGYRVSVPCSLHGGCTSFTLVARLVFQLPPGSSHARHAPGRCSLSKIKTDAIQVRDSPPRVLDWHNWQTTANSAHASFKALKSELTESTHPSSMECNQSRISTANRSSSEVLAMIGRSTSSRNFAREIRDLLMRSPCWPRQRSHAGNGRSHYSQLFTYEKSPVSLHYVSNMMSLPMINTIVSSPMNMGSVSLELPVSMTQLRSWLLVSQIAS